MDKKNIYSDYYKAYSNSPVVSVDFARALTKCYKRTMNDLEICAIINARIASSAVNGENKTYVPFEKFKSDADIRRAITIYNNEGYIVKRLTETEMLRISW